MLGRAMGELQADPAAAEAAAEAFQQLKPICSQLLHARADPQRLTAALDALRLTAASTPAAGMRRCFDYVMYPLLFMLESAATARAGTTGSGSKGGSSTQQHPTISVLAMQQDKAAEALLRCVYVLVQRCQGLEADQVMPVLRHLGALLQLPREALPEEARQDCFNIIQAALQSQQHLPPQEQLLHQPAGQLLGGFLINACLSAADAEVAAAASGSKAVRHASIRALRAVLTGLGPGPLMANVLPGLCSGLAKQLLASVPSSTGASVTGAAAGSSGTVLVLQALALAIKLALSNAAVAHIPPDAQEQQQQQQQHLGAGVAAPPAFTSAADALQTLQQLSLQASSCTPEPHSSGPGSISGPAPDGSSSITATEASCGVVEAHSAATTTAEQQQQQQMTETSTAAAAPLSVAQDAAWLATSSSKVQALLALCLPRLLSHPQAPVRQALAESTADLLTHCTRALHSSRIALTEILLTLASDDYTQVASPAIRWLQDADEVSAAAQHQAPTVPAGHAASAASAADPAPAGAGLCLGDVAARLRRAAVTAAAAQSGTSAAAPAAKGRGHSGTPSTPAAALPPALAQPASPVLPELLLELMLQLPTSVAQGQASGIAAAKRTSAALLCVGPAVGSSVLLSRRHVLQQVCAALAATFTMDPTGAALLLRANVAVLCQVAGDGSSHEPAAAAGGAAAAQPRSAAQPGVAASGHPQLPRMPLSLQYLISSDSYRAAAGVARALGRVAHLADLQQQQQLAGSSNLQGLVQQLLSQLEAAASPHKAARHTAAAHSTSQPAAPWGRSSGPHPAAGEWQCSTAAVAVVLTEVLYGASAAWQPPLAVSAASSCAAGAAARERPAAADAQEATGSTTQRQTPRGPEANRPGGTQQGILGTDAAFEAVLLQVVETVVAAKLWQLPTSQPVHVVSSGPVSAGGTASASSKQEQLPAQVLGANALLLRALIDCVGTVARCAGPAFSSSRLLRTALLPLLERLADPCPLVSTAAAGALHSICMHAGYSQGLSQLVGANADYVVDGVCRQLRGLQQHPHAPQLLAALLREAGVSAALMPLLAEPLRAALSGVSILMRQHQPRNVLPFLYVLQSVASGALQEAQHCRQVFRAQLTASLDEAVMAGLLDGGSDVSTDAPPDSDDDVDEGGPAPGSRQQHGREAQPAAALYFKRRLQQKAAGDTGPGPELSASGASATLQQQQQQQPQCQLPQQAGESALPDVPHLPVGRKLRLTALQQEELELCWRRAHGAAGLAAAAVDAATPLLLLRNLRCVVLSVDVLDVGLRALAASSEALDAEEQLFDRLVDRGPDAAMKPARPTPAKLLPAVHAVWPMLLAALQDTGSVSLLEQQLALLSQVVQLAGGRFMARRFRKDAWPLLQRLLRSGPQAGAATLAARTAAATVGGGAAAAAALLGAAGGPGSDTADPLALTTTPAAGRNGITSRTTSSSGGSSSSSSVFGSALSSMRSTRGVDSGLNAAVGVMVSKEAAADEDGLLAPASLQRVQVAVLGCLEGMCSSTAAAPALQGPLVWDVCVVAAPFLADSTALALREAAAKLLAAAAQVDGDAVWLLLLDLGSCHQDLKQLLPMEPPAPLAVQQGGLHETAAATGANSVARWPELQQLLLPVSTGAAGCEPAGNDLGWRRLLRSREAASCGRRAAVLLPRAGAAHVAWHDKAAQQLAVLHSTA